MKTRALFIAGGLALSLTLTACGNDDEATAVENISAQMKESTDDEFPIEDDQADCVAEGIVDGVGVEKLQEYGLLDDNLEVDTTLGSVTMEKADADVTADALLSCTDAHAMLVEEMAGDDTMTQEQQDCLTEALDEDTLREMFSLILQDKEEEASNNLLGPVMSCMMG